MTCRTFTASISAYRDKDLSRPARQRFETHAARCGKCATYLKGYEATIEAAKRAIATNDAGADPELPQGVVRAIAARNRSRSRF